jgi:hypothetical protein
MAQGFHSKYELGAFAWRYLLSNRAGLTQCNGCCLDLHLWDTAVCHYIYSLYNLHLRNKFVEYGC